MLALAAVVALHALVWFAAGVGAPDAGQPEPEIAYVDLRLIAPQPVRPPPPPAVVAEWVRAPVVPRARLTAPAPPAQSPQTEPAATAAPAAPAVELLPAEPAPAPPSQAERAGPPLDIEALRTAARDYERTRERSPIEKHREQLRKEQHRDAAAEAIAKSARGDCRNAYAGLSLLAIIPIVVDTVRDKGCKW